MDPQLPQARREAYRIQAQAIESQLSVLIVMGISYGSGFIILNSNPDALREFLLSTVGTWVTVGAVMLQRPELFNAVVCQVPLLDMIRYEQIAAGERLQ